MVVIDVSSSTLGFSNMIAKSLLTLADDPSQRAGLVLASQSAYVALPPETPGSALRGWQRMIGYINEQNHKLAVRAKLDRTPLPNPAPGDYPWVGSVHGRHPALDRARARDPGAARAGHSQRSDRAGQRPARCAGGSPPRRRADRADARARDQAPRRHRGARRSRDPKEFSDFGGSAFITDAADSVYAPEREPALPSRPSALPLVLLGVALAVLLAAVEPLLPLRWRSSPGGARMRRQSATPARESG